MYSQIIRWSAPDSSGTDKLIYCYNNYFLGGVIPFPSPDAEFVRQYNNLPQHSTIMFSFWVRLIDYWASGDDIEILLDSTNVGFENNVEDLTNTASTVNYCGNSSSHDLDLNIFGRVQHSSSSLTLTIVNKRNSPSSSGTFGFREIYLMFSNNTISTTQEKWILPFVDGVDIINVTNCTDVSIEITTVQCDNCTVVYYPVNTTICDNHTTTVNTTTCASCVNTLTYTDTTSCDSCVPNVNSIGLSYCTSQSAVSVEDYTACAETVSTTPSNAKTISCDDCVLKVSDKAVTTCNDYLYLFGIENTTNCSSVTTVNTTPKKTKCDECTIIETDVSIVECPIPEPPVYPPCTNCTDGVSCTDLYTLKNCTNITEDCLATDLTVDCTGPDCADLFTCNEFIGCTNCNGTNCTDCAASNCAGLVNCTGFTNCTNCVGNECEICENGTCYETFPANCTVCVDYAVANCTCCPLIPPDPVPPPPQTYKVLTNVTTTTCDVWSRNAGSIVESQCTSCSTVPTVTNTTKCTDCNTVMTVVPTPNCHIQTDIHNKTVCNRLTANVTNCTLINEVTNKTNCTNIGTCNTDITNPFYYYECPVEENNDPTIAELRNCSAETTVQNTTTCTTQISVNPVIVPLPGKFPCTSNQYYDSGTGSCLSCHANCEFCYGPTASECYKCSASTYYTGTTCVSCHSSCYICHGTTANDCDYCKPPYYLLDSSCISCASPFEKSTANNYGHCVYPCKLSEYLYSDGSCHPTCDSRLTATTSRGRQLCKFPCSGASKIRYFDSTCSSTACTFPLALEYYGAYQICEYPCATGEILYYNSTCSSTSCYYPFVTKTYTRNSQVFSTCEPLCSSSDYRQSNGSCTATCPSPLVSKTIEDIKICDPPMCGVVECDSCTTSSDCRAYYHCETYLGGYCIADYTYSLSITASSTFLNGIEYTVEASPDRGLDTGTDDNLYLSIDGLKKNTDYTYKIAKQSAGKFLVTITLLQSTDGKTCVATFSYSPKDLQVKGSTTLPRITFFSESMTAATDNVDSASQITFLLFIISIVGMLAGDGLTSLWTSLPESQYTYYMLYLNVDYLHHTQTYLESMDNYNFLTSNDNSQKLATSLKDSLPTKFFSLNYSPSFYSNADQILLQLVLMIAFLIISMLSLRYLRFTPQLSFVPRLMYSLVKIIQWNGLIRQIMTYILPISIAAFVQIYASVFRGEPTTISMILAAVSIVFLVWFLIKMYWIISYNPPTRFDRAMHSKSYGTLWEDLYLNSLGRYYFWIVSIRGVVLAYVAVFFDFNPYVQVGTLIVYQVIVVGLFIKGRRIRKVFHQSGLNIKTFIEEFLLLVMKIMIFLTVMFEDSASDGFLIMLGWMIIFPAIMVQILQTAYPLAMQIKNRKKLWIKIQLFYRGITGKKSKKRIKRVNVKASRFKDLKQNQHSFERLENNVRGSQEHQVMTEQDEHSVLNKETTSMMMK